MQIVEQVPASHAIEQHSAGAPHGEPPGLHIPVPQMLLTQAPEQHCPSEVHAIPSFRQALLQMPFAHPPPQHSDGATQVSPSFLHVGVAQRPSAQAPEQHEVPKSQIDPAPRHEATHCPLWHWPEQHSPGAAQAPLALQPVPVEGPTSAVAPPEPPPPKLTCGSLLHPANAAYDPTAKTSPDQARKKLTDEEVITTPVSPATAAGQPRSIDVLGASPGTLANAEKCCAS